LTLDPFVNTRAARAWWVAVVCGLASYIDACAIFSSGTALVIYKDTIGITPGQIGLLSGALIFCIAIGALIGGRLGDRYGRRSVFILTMVMIVAGSSMLMVMTSFIGLFLGTVLVGLGAGADLPVSLAAIAEAATDENRGKMLGFSQIMWILGILGALACSSVVGNMGRLGGQIIFSQPGVVACITLLLRIGIPESAKWKASRALRSQGAGKIPGKGASVGDLMKAPFWAPFLALIVFYPLTNMGVNTGGQFGTYLWVNVIGKSVRFASLIGVAGFPLSIFWAYLFMRIVDSPKRFPYFQAGAVAMLMHYFVPAVFGFSTATMIAATLLGGFAFAFAFEGIMKVWTQESFPTLLRSTAQGTIIMVARVLAGSLAIFTPYMIDAAPRTLYFVLGALSFAGLATAWFGFRKGVANTFETEERLRRETSEPAFAPAE
jgi:inositol transporter-like SP family MFS transporter